MGGTAPRFNAYVRGMKEDYLWIDFATKEEKWAFLKTHLPDIADGIKKISKVTVFSPPIIHVKQNWLHSLNDVQIHY